MVAIAYNDITFPVTPDRRAAAKRLERRPAVTSDPVVDMTTRLLSVPLHQMYALLWRVGLLVAEE